MFYLSMVVLGFLITWLLVEIVIGAVGLFGDIVLNLLANDNDDDRY